MTSYLERRKTDQLVEIFHQVYKADLKTPAQGSTSPLAMILSSPHDLGVARNGGRRGARFAAEAVLAGLKKLAKPEGGKTQGKLYHFHGQHEELDYPSWKKQYSEEIQQLMDSSLWSQCPFIQLGGGHDHILSAVAKGFAEHFFRFVQRVRIGGVKKVDAAVDGAVHQFISTFLVECANGIESRFASATECHRTHADFRDYQSTLA